MLHRFTFDGLRIVLDTNSGAVHVVDEIAWKILEYYSQFDRRTIMEKLTTKFDSGEVREALDEVEDLVGKGLLYGRDRYEVQACPGGGGIIKALCLHLAHDCNLRCRYCFAGQGPFGGDRSLMPFRVGAAAIDFLLEHSGPRKHVEVDFFGGEPLLNGDVLRKLVDYGKDMAGKAGKEIKFTVTTNGLLLKGGLARYLVREGLSVVLSLDGRPEVHNAMRPYSRGGGSYEAAATNIVDFIKKQCVRDYYVRGTYTRYNTDFAADVMHMVHLGLNNISVEPVVGAPGEDYSLQEDDLPKLYAEYEKLTRELLAMKRRGREINFFHFNIDLEGGPCLKKRLSGCGAGNEYVAVTPGGEIFPCHQFVGEERFKLGDVFSGLTNHGVADHFQRAHIYNKEDCSRCWAKYFCSGGCHANAFFSAGTIYRPYEIGCRLMKKRLECALYLKARAMTDSTDVG